MTVPSAPLGGGHPATPADATAAAPSSVHPSGERAAPRLGPPEATFAWSDAARLAAVVESSADGIGSFTVDGIIDTWNRGAERLYGYTAGEIVGKHLSVLVPEDLRADAQALFAEVCNGGTLEQHETRRTRKDGTCIDVSITHSPIFDRHSHAVVGVSAVARDITHDIVTMRELRRQRALDGAMLQAIDEFGQGLIVVEGDRNVYVNDAVTEMSGYGYDELLGHLLPNELFDPADLAVIAADRVEFLAGTKQHAHYLLHVTRKDGTARDVETATRAMIVDGRALRVTLVRDITEQLRSNAALRRYAHQLQTINERLLEHDRLKSDFVAKASHELRTPLTAIGGFANTLHTLWDELDDEDKRRYLAVIEEQAARLSRLVNDLLTISGIESGETLTRRTRVLIQPVVQQALSLLHAPPDVDVRCGFEVAVWADADQLAEALCKLVENAIEHGAPPLRIEAGADDDAVTISVCDAGLGIPDDFHSRLFDRFAQASAGSGRRTGGSGLGLAIARELVKANDGEIGYERRPDTGACFWIRLPSAG